MRLVKSTYFSLAVVFGFCCQFRFFFILNGFCDSSFKYLVVLSTQSESTHVSGLAVKLPAENPNDKLRGVKQTGLLSNSEREEL